MWTYVGGAEVEVVCALILDGDQIGVDGEVGEHTAGRPGVEAAVTEHDIAVGGHVHAATEQRTTEMLQRPTRTAATHQPSERRRSDERQQKRRAVAIDVACAVPYRGHDPYVAKQPSAKAV